MEKRLEMPQLYAELEVSTGAVGDTDLGYRSQLGTMNDGSLKRVGYTLPS